MHFTACVYEVHQPLSVVLADVYIFRRFTEVLVRHGRSQGYVGLQGCSCTHTAGITNKFAQFAGLTSCYQRVSRIMHKNALTGPLGSLGAYSAPPGRLAGF